MFSWVRIFSGLVKFANMLLAAARERRLVNLGRRLSTADQMEEVIERAEERNRIEREVEFMSPDERKHWLSGGWRSRPDSNQ